LFQNPDDLAFRESGRLHAKFPVDPAARKFYLEHPLILGGTTGLSRVGNPKESITQDAEKSIRSAIMINRACRRHAPPRFQ
ncbi:hypothetical protein, partial [Burkholderia gladioli]